MLDADGVVIADQPQLGNNSLPEVHTVTVTHSTEDPGTVQFLAVVLGIQHTVHGGVDGIHIGILGVEVEDSTGLAQFTDDSAQIHALPDQMAGIQVCADLRTAGLSQPQQRLGVVHAEAGVQLQSDLHIVRSCESGLFLPVGDQNIVPLVLQGSGEILGPGAGDPVGGLVAGGAAGAAGERVDHGNAQLLSQKNCIDKILFIRSSNSGVGMDHVAVSAQGADLQTMLMNGIQELLALLLVSQQFLSIAMGVARAAAAANLNSLNALGSEIAASLIQGHTAQRHSKYT